MRQTSAAATAAARFAKGFHGVRYQVGDVQRSVTFYTEQLRFELEHEHLPAFASISLGDLTILPSGPDASGSRPTAGARSQGVESRGAAGPGSP